MVEWKKVKWNGVTFEDGETSTGDVPSDLNELRELKQVDNYDASNPGNDDVVLYKSTWWRYVKGTGWVEQVFHQNTQRIMDKGLPVGPSDNAPVKGFGKSVNVTSQRYELRNWIGDVYQRGVSYGPSDNQEGAYKIENSAVVAYWDNRNNMWYAVNWNQNTQKFTKADNIAPEGQPLKVGLTVRKWQDSIKVSDVEVDQEFYDGNTWWVKQNGQLVEQEWNPRNDQFRPKNSGLRGPCGKLVVGRFGKEMDIKELTGVNAYQDMHTGEVYMAVPDRAYVDAKTDVVYYHATNGVGQKWWWYARWDQGIGLFYATWKISYGPTSGKVRPWIPSTDGPFDVYTADDNVIVWDNNNFWKKMDGLWVQYRWDANNYKFVKKLGATKGGMIAPVAGNTWVAVFEDREFHYTRNTIQDQGSKAKGSYIMDGYEENVYWWDGRKWYEALWDPTTRRFESGSSEARPYSTFVVKFKSGIKFSDVQVNMVFWYRGTIWKKNSNELVQCALNNGTYEEMSDGRRVPIGNNVKVKRFVQENVSGSVTENNPYMDPATGRVYWRVA